MLNRIVISGIIGIFIIISGYSFAHLEHLYRPELKLSFNELPKETQKQITCLADNIFFESAHEPTEGKKAVAFVTLNRMYSGQYPNQICDVVKQKTKFTCQFSWYCEEKPKRISYSKDLTSRQEVLYNEIRDIAIYVYLNYDRIKDPTKGALFYHADYVNPYWSKHKIKTVQIGRHIFYMKREIS